MPRLIKSYDRGEGQTAYRFFCPGCKCSHFVSVPMWNWNGSEELPTLTPSVLVSGKKTCHSFVKDGTIQFLGDCDHDLKNQTVDLPEVD